MKIINRLLSKVIIALIRGYQKLISPLMLPGMCRFIPTCSQYFIQAVEKYGAFRGSVLGIRRLLKCHPFHKGGFDPLP